MNYRIFAALPLILLLAGCTQEPPILDIDVVPEALAVDAGQDLAFTITGRADFLVFYSGLEGQRYADYPAAKGLTINMTTPDPTFAFRYNFHGTTRATFVATSYGNWSESQEEKVFEFDITVSDNSTLLSLATLKTPGLTGREYIGVIDPATSTVTVSMPAGVNLTNLTTNLVTASTRAAITFNGNPFTNKSSVNFSGGSRTFRVTAAGGAVQDWVVQIVQ
ncbi:MAG: hypothetical protein OHK0039_22810 [Bacteroidia bacterium]